MKRKVSKIIASLLAVILLFTMLAGCELITTDNERDMNQVVAEVNIARDAESLNEAFDLLGAKELSLSAENLDSITSTDSIYKRDLIAYFLSYGYNYISQGSSYAEAVSEIMNVLVERKILTQFAVVYYLNEGKVRVDKDSITVDGGYTKVDNSNEMVMDGEDLTVEGYLAAMNVDGTADEKAIEGYKYLLTDAEVQYATYTVMNSINSSIDSYEEEIIAADSNDSTSSTTDRTMPTGANSLGDGYYPTKADGSLDYAIYTGINNVSDCGEYEKVTGSTSVTRKRAYLRFINALRANYLIGEGENITDITGLDYFDMELKTQLEQMLITKFSASVALNMSSRIDAAMAGRHYDELLEQQKNSDFSTFTTTMDSMSDTSFILYSPAGEKYGFVYNILLPFSAKQSLRLDELKGKYGETSAEYYAARNALYEDIEATDQRSSWFNGSEDYSYEATEYYGAGQENRSNRLFFEDSFTGSNPELIDKYAGRLSYNGKVDEKTDGDGYKLTPNKLKIDDFIAEMEGYINYVANDFKASEDSGFVDYITDNGWYRYSVVGNTPNERYEAHWDADSESTTFFSVPADAFEKSDATDRTIYNHTIYYKGHVNGVSDVSKSNTLVKDQVSYKALSAVNELMFAYTTDTAALNSYYGYSLQVDAASSYVAEFEYAAQQAISEGAGTYYVVGTDYGWHIIYVTFTFNGEDVYGNFNSGDMFKEGTFSYLFYQNFKNSTVSSYIEDRSNDVLTKMHNDTVVTLYPKAYEDISSIQA